MKAANEPRILEKLERRFGEKFQLELSDYGVLFPRLAFKLDEVLLELNESTAVEREEVGWFATRSVQAASQSQRKIAGRASTMMKN